METKSFPKLFLYVILCFVLLFAFNLLAGCKGDMGSAGPAGPTTGIATGTVTALDSTPLSGVTVTASITNSNSAMPGIPASTQTDASGKYSLSLPAGVYTLTFGLTNYTTATSTPVNVSLGITTTTNVTLSETSSLYPSVALTANLPTGPYTANTDIGYNTQFSLNTTVTPNPNGSSSFKYSWSTSAGSVTSNSNTATPYVDTNGYLKSGVVSNGTSTAQASTPTVAAALAGHGQPGQLGYVAAYNQPTTLGVLPVFADTRGATTVTVTVTDGRGGSVSKSVTVNAAAVQTGVKNVAVGVPVYLNSGVTGTTTWSFTSVPAGSQLTSTYLSAGQNPGFVPDVAGQYVISTGTGSTITLNAGTWLGVIASGNDITKTITSSDRQWDGMWITIPTNGASSVTYTNWPVVTPDSTCMVCHNNSTAPDNFTPWTQTAHATFYSRGIENITSNSDSCTTCHTVGTDVTNATPNGGYDDVATATGFTYKKYPGAWADMSSLTSTYNSVARVANIQCENCHGPQTTPGYSHSTDTSSPTSPNSVRVSYGTEVCATCHMSGGGHHIVSEWLTVDPDTNWGHSNIANSGVFPTTSDSCSRCHSAQGYGEYVDQLNAGVTGTLATVDWTKANVQPVTCTACHDPHDDSNPNQLRMYDSTPNLPSGFSVMGLGKGALCVTCHNTRNGVQCASAPTATGSCATPQQTLTYLHEDGEIYNGGNPASYSAPHDAAQADVFMGRNAYFMGAGNLPMISKHANVEDACVGCHIVLNPQTHDSGHGGAPVISTSGHVMYIRDLDAPTVCANCHGSGASVIFSGVTDGVESLMATLKGKLVAAMTAKINANLTSGVYVNGTKLTSLTSLDLTDSHGQIAFIVNGTTYSLGTITTDSGKTTPLVSLSDPLVKGCWNYILIEMDSSKGVHNPSFVKQMLNNTIARF